MEIPDEVKEAIIDRFTEVELMVGPEGFALYQLGFMEAIKFVIHVGSLIKEQQESSFSDDLMEEFAKLRKPKGWMN